ncbi:MAG TPA: metal ABC transporter permease [Nitrospiria bacterium]|nr:metal ABC transporter permease [Nitrospiria bacterium]
MEFVIEPLRYDFFLRGLLAAILTGSLCGVIGVFIVLRGMSYIGHGLSHAVFGGAVVSYLINLNFYVGAGCWGFISALLIKRITKTKKIGADAAIGIITTASFALGVALISRVRRFTRNLEAALFGNILGVTAEDLYVIAGVLIISFITIFLLYKELLFTTFDKETAEVFGVDTGRVDTFFSLILAAAIIASMQVIGVTLIAAALVIPAITARLLTDSFHKMIILSLILGMLTAIAGMYASYYLNAASGATIVLVATLLFSIVIGVTEITKRRRKRQA